MNKPRRYFEFFAGGGMARAGLGSGWSCEFANDFCSMKADVYQANWGHRPLVRDINELTAADLPGCADLAWASFPCQDLSLAGSIRGLGTEERQTRSGAFWAFWRLIVALGTERRAPPLIVLENVYGSLTANDGRDFAIIARCLALEGYRFGAVVLDAAEFVPQSRPRVFIVAVRGDWRLPDHIQSPTRIERLHPSAMERAVDRLADVDREQWFWLAVPRPFGHPVTLDSVIEENPAGVAWHTEAETARLVDMMDRPSLLKLDTMRQRDRAVGTIYKRTRPDASGIRRQRAELRDDGIAGCLRTPGGGSSRQTVLVAEDGRVRTRLLSPREAARLMGLSDSYALPPRYNDAYKVAGDGVVVPVVRHLSATVLEPVLAACLYPILVAAE